MRASREIVGMLALVLFWTTPGFTLAQWSNITQDKNGEPTSPRWELRTRGRFGDRTIGGVFDEPQRSTMFPDSGLRYGASGEFYGRDRRTPSSMFSPLAPGAEGEIATRSQPNGLPVLIRPNELLADTIPHGEGSLPPASAPRRLGPPLGRTWTPDDDWQRPPTGYTGDGEEVWMRSPDAGAIGAGPLAPGSSGGVLGSAIDAGQVPIAGPGGPNEASPSRVQALATENPQPTSYSAAQNQRIALRLAHMVVQSPGVRPITPLTVTYLDGTATIEGVVPTSESRAYADRLLRLDSDVLAVRNLLTLPDSAVRNAPQALIAPRR